MQTPARPDAPTEYAKLRPQYEQFVNRTAELLGSLIDAAGIRYQSIERRAKDVESFRQKILKPEKKYDDPVRDVTDLAGVRVIVYYTEDVEKVGELIRNNFAVSAADSGDTASLLRPNEFGYRSAHHVVILSESRAHLPEWKAFADMAAEIQVRTVLQHAWAAISHSLQYKSEVDAPQQLARRLFRLSGLLELADEEFLAIARERRAISVDVASAISAGELDIPVDRDSLEEYIATAATPQLLTALAVKCGFSLSDDYEIYEEPSDSLGDLVWVAKVAGIRSVRELDRVAMDALPIAASYFSQLRGQTDKPWAADAAFFTELALFLRRGQQFSTRMLVQRGWSEDVADRVVSTAAVVNAA